MMSRPLMRRIRIWLFSLYMVWSVCADLLLLLGILWLLLV